MKLKLYTLCCVVFFTQQLIAQEISFFKDLNTGRNGSSPSNFRVVGNNLYFSALDKIYVSNSENSDANIISPNLRAGKPHEGVVFNGSLYFAGQYGNQGEELCVVNSNTGSLVSDINPGAPISGIKNLIEHQGKIYFSANNGIQGSELWVHNPATGETNLVKNIREDDPSIAGSNIANMTIHNNELYFTVQEVNGQRDLWKTNGTEVGTEKIAIIDLKDENDPDDDIIATDIEHLIDFNGRLYFSASADNLGKELWVYNGANNSSKLVKDLKTGRQGSIPQKFIKYNNQLLFFANVENNRGNQLFKTDGTEEGTVFIKTLFPTGNATVYENTFFEFNNKLYFHVLKGFSTSGLFTTDATSDNTFEIAELGSGSNAGLEALKSVAYKDRIYFYGRNDDGEKGIWQSTGLPDENSEITTDAYDKSYAPRDFTIFNDKLFFTARHPDFGIEIFTLFKAEQTYVPDDNFEQFLINAGYDSGDLDNYVYKDSIKDLTSLDISRLEISDATGLEDFIALETLNISNNILETFEPNNNTNLQILNISNNRLTSLNTGSYTNLKTLDCSANLLSDLHVLDNVSLLNLNANNNQLNELETSGNFDLQRLEVNNNELENLILLGNYSLIYVDCSFNNLTNLEVFNSSNLTDIICNNNDIKKLELNLPTLKNITVNNNNLYILRAFTENIQNIETFNALNNENLCCIEIDDVTYADANFTNIDEQTTFSLDCNFNELTYVPDDNFEQALIDLGYDDFLDDYVNTVYLKNVEQLLISSENIEENKIRDLTGIEGLSNLKTLILAGHKITDLDLSSNTNLEKVVAQFNEIESVILPETERLTEVDFWGNKLSAIDVSNLPNLKKLALYNNELSSINTSQNPYLETLNVSLNTLNSIDITNNTKLTSLYITLAGLTELDVSQNINLETLDCTNNALTTLDVTQNNNLRTLNCSSNNTIESLNVSNNRLLETLNCMQNDIAVLDISNNIRLTDFDARINNLTCIQVWDVDFANQNWSEKIDASASFGESCYTRISDKKFEQALIDKEFDNTLDGYILTSRANAIEQLIIPSKQISDLSGIEDFTALTFLNISNNNLTSLDVSNNTSLSSLIVDQNELERLDISTNTSLFSLKANNNNLTCIQVYDEAFANTNWSKGIDATASFSEDCDDKWTVEVDKDVKDILVIISGIDEDNDGEITLKEAKEFSGSLDLSNKDIKNIEGLQAFENITSLNLSGNKLKDLSALTGKTITLIRKTTGKKKQVSAKASKLETLIVSDNSFETLNLEELKDLKAINVSNNPSLETLSVKNGTNASVTSFNATNTPNLSCIIVDDKNANYLNTWTKDTKAGFVANLNDCRNKVLSTPEFVPNDVKIYPNPVTNILSVESVRDLDYIEIYNLLGKRLLRTEKTEVHFSNYTSGIYILKIIINNQIVTKRVVKE